MAGKCGDFHKKRDPANSFSFTETPNKLLRPQNVAFID